MVVDEVLVDMVAGNETLFSRFLLPRTGVEGKELSLRLFVRDSTPASGFVISPDLSKTNGTMGSRGLGMTVDSNTCLAGSAVSWALFPQG